MDYSLALRPVAMLARGTRELAIVRTAPATAALAAPARTEAPAMVPIVVIQQLMIELAVPVTAVPTYGSIRSRRALAAYVEPVAIRPLLAIA